MNELDDIFKKMQSIPYSDNQIDYVIEKLKGDEELKKKYLPKIKDLYYSWVDFGNMWDKDYDNLCYEILENTNKNGSETEELS